MTSPKVKGHPEVNLPSALRLPANYFGRTPDNLQECKQLLGTKVIWGSLGMKLLRNTIWPPNFVGRTTDYCFVQGHAGVFWGQPGVKLSRNVIWPPNLAVRTLDQSFTHCWVKGQVGVIQGQPYVNLLWNALRPPNLVERTPGQSVRHCWAQRSCRSHLGSTRGQICWGMTYGHQIWLKESLTRA